MAVGFRFPLFCMLFALFSAAAISAAHSAPAPAVDCSSLVLNMADCLSYVTAGGTAKKPEGMCCSGLKTVLKTNAECLCEAFQNSAQLGVTLNMTKALGLPAACHVSAPSVSNCALSTSPGAAPGLAFIIALVEKGCRPRSALSPMALSPSSVAGAPTAGIGANEAAPTPTPGNSASFALTAPIELLVFTTVAAVSFALF
ncbi:hypothetical protein DH2020_011146 [Rehmannia glutinosa]|uniref:Bifunctional inhibitor/plant lipid transfer protein/seed storage helical domain-containing protein n=1 Tax=Rehmannia glutinosa TaxID=99300 RepID=A0ABR0XD80_REHGL